MYEKNKILIFLAAIVVAGGTGYFLAPKKVSEFNLNHFDMVDMSHTYGDDTIYWPTSPTVWEQDEVFVGQTDGGYFYSAYSFCTPEHGGTHVDAPIHFSAKGVTVEKVSLDRYITKAVVIDVSEKAMKDRNYLVTAEDVLAFEKEHGKIQPSTGVIVRTGWSKFWPNAKEYMGDDTPGDASKLQFPSFGAEAAKLLVERKVVMIGIDTASVDYGKSKDFIVHRIVADKNIVGLENLTNLEQLPATGFYVISLPVKAKGGSGGPAWVVALVPKD